jgi:hypothetical protein
MQKTVCGKTLRAAQTRDGAIVSLVGSRPIVSRWPKYGDGTGIKKISGQPTPKLA